MGRLIIPPGSRVYLDTAPIIYTTERHQDYSPILESFWQEARLGRIEVVTSELTVLESLVLPIRQNNVELVETYDDLFANSAIELCPISATVLREAAQLRATLNFKTPDAIHCATAILSACVYLIANDNGFRRLRDIEVVILDDLL